MFITYPTDRGDTITLKRLKQLGYQSLTDVYIDLNSSLCEQLNTACADFIGKTR